MSADQKEHLSDIPAADAKALQEAIGLVVDKGGSIHIERVNEKSPGTLIVQPAAAAAPLSAAVAAGGGVSSGSSVNPAFSVGIFHCTFDRTAATGIAGGVRQKSKTGFSGKSDLEMMRAGGTLLV